jgi:hypothetical protein
LGLSPLQKTLALAPALLVGGVIAEAKSAEVQEVQEVQAALHSPLSEDDRIQRWFSGDAASSFVACMVGRAEGTRTKNCDRTSNWYGHADPGDKLWNLGSFSAAPDRFPGASFSTPEDADRWYLKKRLKGHAQQLTQDAKRIGLTLTNSELINGIDLANQSPAAALPNDGQGYLWYLAKWRRYKIPEQERIIRARTNAFYDPSLGRYSATGLGSGSDIVRDQKRRVLAIAGVNIN